MSTRSIDAQYLRRISCGAYDDEDTVFTHNDVDFSSVGLYLVGLQVCFVTIVCAALTVVSCWMLPPTSVSAVRTLAITVIAALVLLYKPLRVGRVRGACDPPPFCLCGLREERRLPCACLRSAGVHMIFNALRPCVAIYISCVVVEQLVHACTTASVGAPRGDSIGADSATTASLATYYTACVSTTLSGLARARLPRSESDIWFLVTLASLLCVAMLPASGKPHAGPLCESVRALEATERVIRASFFSFVYSAFVYAAAPLRHATNEIFVCVARAAAASVWIVLVPVYMLLLVPVQVVLILATSLSAPSHQIVHTSVDDSEDVDASERGAYTVASNTDPGSDGENGSTFGGDGSDHDTLKAAIAHARALKGVPSLTSPAIASTVFAGRVHPPITTVLGTNTNLTFRLPHVVDIDGGNDVQSPSAIEVQSGNAHSTVLGNGLHQVE